MAIHVLAVATSNAKQPFSQQKGSISLLGDSLSCSWAVAMLLYIAVQYTDIAAMSNVLYCTVSAFDLYGCHGTSSHTCQEDVNSHKICSQDKTFTCQEDVDKSRIFLYVHIARCLHVSKKIHIFKVCSCARVQGTGFCNDGCWVYLNANDL